MGMLDSESFRSRSARPIVCITGATGLIGNYLFDTAARYAAGWRVVPLTHAEVDITDASAVRNYFEQLKPDAVIHCAAMSKSPACQANPELAWKINVDATRLLAELSGEIPFIFFSSDLVFDGKKGNYSETDAPSPLNVYAETKIAAEKIVLSNPRHCVVRISLNAGKSRTADRAFNEEMRNAWMSGKKFQLFTDEFRCPIPAPVTARVTWELLEKKATGLFHVAGSERLSRYRIGELLARCYPEANPQFEASSVKDYKGAPRPHDTSLDCSKVQRLLSFPLPRFSEWVEQHAAEL